MKITIILVKDKPVPRVDKSTLKADVKLSDFLFLVPSKDDKKILAIEGKVSAKLKFNSQDSLKPVLIDYKKNNPKPKIIEEKKEGEKEPEEVLWKKLLNTTQLGLQDFSIFFCNIDDFNPDKIQTQFQPQKKKRLLDPFSVNLTLKDFLAINESDQFKSVKESISSLGKLKLSISYQV